MQIVLNFEWIIEKIIRSHGFKIYFAFRELFSTNHEKETCI